MRVAFTGSQGVGKTTLASYARDFLTSSGDTVNLLGSYTRPLRERGVESPLLDLACAVNRHVDWTVPHTEDHLVTERTAIDELVYGAGQLTTIEEDTISMLAQEELLDLDLLFYKPPHPDYPPVDDGMRTSSVKYQTEIDLRFKSILFRGTSSLFMPAQLNFIPLSVDLEVAKSEVIIHMSSLLDTPGSLEG